MPKIEEDKFYTVIVEIKTEPAQQQAFIDALANYVERHFKSYSGFISASYHASEDGHRVYNYAQWDSKNAYESFLASDRGEAKELLRRFGAEALRVNHPLRVARIIE